MEDCIFCKIVRGEKEEEKIYEDEEMVVVADIKPRTPVHLLIIPKVHYDDFRDMMKKDPRLLSKMGIVVQKLVVQLNLTSQPHTWGFHAGGKQSVDHVHAQLLAGTSEGQLVL